MTEHLTYDPSACFEVISRDVEYRNDGERSWLAHVWQPRGPGPFPALIEVHAGAWYQYNRLYDSCIIEPLAESGIVVAAIDFHLSHEAPYPSAQADINYGTRWLKAHAREFNASPAFLGGLGISSGGHQLMLNAMRPHDSRYAALPLIEAPEVDASIAYVVMGWVPIDPWNRYSVAREAGDQRRADATLAYFTDETGMKEGNPQLILDRGETVETPPVLLVQGSADEGINPGVAERFVETYAASGGLIELGKFPGEPHYFMHTPGLNTTRALAMMKSFIARRLEEAMGPRPD